MAVVIAKSDIVGSNLTLGYKDFNKDQALRKFYIEAATTDDKDAVLTALKNSIGLMHNELTDLPLQTINVIRIGIGTWMATAIYNRSAASGLPQTNTLMADLNETFEYVSCVATTGGIFGSNDNYENGLPAGPINIPASLIHNPGARSAIVRTSIPVPVGRVKVPFERGVHPNINYAMLLGTTNKSAVANLFGPTYSAKPHTLVFEGIQCKTVATATGIRYGGYYIFKHRMTGFRSQVEYFESGFPTRGIWKWGWEFHNRAVNWPTSFS